MATYKEIFGKQVKFLSSDPANQAEGQIWYNSTSSAFKTVVMSEAWRSGNTSPTAKRSGGSAGTQTANVIWAGSIPGGEFNGTAEYNGTGWSTSANYGASVYGICCFGIQTAAIGQGGHPGGSPGGFEYDGSTWTATPAVNTACSTAGGAGTTAAGLKFGGATVPFATTINSSEEWTGSTWTASPGNLTTARGYASGFGTQTAALGAGGYTSPPTVKHTNTEYYDGSTWTASTVLPIGRMMGAASGTQTAAFYYGGSDASPSITSNSGQMWDGSAWTTSPATLGTGRRNCGGSPAGTSSSALATCGTDASPANVTLTEEFDRSTDAFTAAAWASAPALSVARYGSVGAGTTQNTALVAAGTQAPSYAGKSETEQYDGSSWTAGGVYPTAGGGMRGCGPQTAVLATNNTVTNYYDGSTWTAQPSPTHNLPVTKSGTMMCGTQTAGLMAGGYVPGPNVRTTATEEYDGSGWTASPGTLTNAVSGVQGFGIQTAAIRVAGDLGPANTTNVDSYNGTTWTASTACPVGIKDGFACGTQTAGLLASGAGPSPADAISTVCTSFDGTAWFSSPSMATSRRDNTGGSASAPSTSTTNAGGNNPPTTSITTAEEFTGETTALNYQTVTTS